MARYIPRFTPDDLTVVKSIKEDMTVFLRSNSPPIFTDEIQYVPELFCGIKMIVDERKDEPANGAMNGRMFETYIVCEILKSYYNAGKEPSMYFYRNDKAEEMDLIFHQDGTLYPAEIKKTASPNSNDVNKFKLLQGAFPSMEIGEGGVICMYDKVLPLGGKAKIIPVNRI